MAQWTQEQLKAIEARGTNILLSAAAGSGKTTVLVERVLRLIENDGAQIDRMLIVTFSRAASADMRRKLSEQLGRRAAEGSENCRLQQPLMERASISTLHGFCSEFLRGHFESAGVDPAFRVLDETETKRIADAALDEAMEEAYKEPSEELRALTYGRKTKDVRKMVEALLRVLEDRSDPEAWLGDACTVNPEKIEMLAGELVNSVKKEIEAAILLYRQALDDPECSAGYAGPIINDLAALSSMMSIDGFDPLLRALNDFEPETVKKGKAAGTPSQRVKDLRKNAKKILDGISLRAVSFGTLVSDMYALAPRLRVLADIALRARAIGLEKHGELSGLSYNDLEHFTLLALRDDATADALREQYDYIFVDEYQDTSEVQEALITRICRDGNLFMVGDVKQSIYGFRNAEPRLFRGKYDAYKNRRGGELLPLTRNFRSREGVLELVNRTFEIAMHGGDSEIEYDEMARLNLGNPELTGGGGELHLLTPPAGEEKEDNELADCELQAAFIARRILQMRSEDPSLRWRDFAVLTRTRTNLLGRMAAQLTAYGIPAFANDADAYYETVEITLAVDLISLIVNRKSSVELVGVLRSRLTGLTLNDLAKIRVAQPAGNFADAVQAYRKNPAGEAPIKEKLDALFARLDHYELLSHCMELGVLLKTVFTDIGLYDMACALPGGALRQANLDRLCENAAAYDRDISGSLSRFLEHVNKLKKDGFQEETHVVGENDDVVRLMTVHKSKGLEFPIVFGAMLQRPFARRGHGDAIAAHRALGFGFEYIDPELRSKRKTMIQYAVKARKQREEHAEELRVLYVLMTRAKDRLILVGSAKDGEKLNDSCRSLRACPDLAANDLELLLCALGDGADGLCPVTVHPFGEAAEVPEIMPPKEDDITVNEELARTLLWRYPDDEAAHLPLKLTVTGLLREVQSPDAVEIPVRRPAFLSETTGRMSGAEQGTAFHRLMQCLDLNALRGKTGAALCDEITRQADALAEKNRMTKLQREAVSVPAVARFFSGEVGRRLLNAEEVRREWPFNVMMRMSEALTQAEAGQYSDREILVQGTPDCCFIENGEWVLLDYKTDRTNDEAALTQHYGDQLRMYALALERVTGMRVKEIVLCLLRSGEAIRINR